MTENMVLTIRDQIAEQLRSDIIAGDLAPNEKLNEPSLANRFGVSRGPIRDVLLQLTKEGLLVSKSNCGMSVNGALSPGFQGLMQSIRLQLETFAIQELEGKLTEEDFENLDRILNRIRIAFEDGDTAGVTIADIEFHRYLLVRAGGDELLNVWHPIVLRMLMNYKRADDMQCCLNEHRAIVEALKASNFEEAINALKLNIRN